MSAVIRSSKDFWSGAIFLAFGLGAVLIGRDYSMGSAAKMGPAYFPTILGGLLAVIGAVAILRSILRRGNAVEPLAIKGTLLVVGSTILFGVLVRDAGLAIAIVALVMTSGLASVKFKLAPYLLLGVGLAAFCVLVFVKALGLPMPMFGPWLGF